LTKVNPNQSLTAKKNDPVPYDSFSAFVWWVKIGYAHTSAVKRAAALDKAVFGVFIPIGILVIPFAYTVEQYFTGFADGCGFAFIGPTDRRKHFGCPLPCPFWHLCFLFGGCIFGQQAERSGSMGFPGIALFYWGFTSPSNKY
jgi:hypothetical protein